MRYVLLLLSVAAFGLAPALSHAEDAPAAKAPDAFTKSFSDAQRAEIEGIIKQYLTQKSPEVVMEAVQELQKRQQVDSEVKSQQAVASSHDKIFNNPDTPTGGNPKGDVQIAEFFDFQCGYCKMSETGIEKLLKEDKSVKFIYKDFPILGPESIQASKAALASVRQKKYIPFHDALMNNKEHLTDDIIFKLAKDVGLDIDRLKKDMADAETEKLIQANLDLGSDLGVRGTPMFVINDQVYPGALQYEQLKKAIDVARAAGKKP